MVLEPFRSFRCRTADVRKWVFFAFLCLYLRLFLLSTDVRDVNESVKEMQSAATRKTWIVYANHSDCSHMAHYQRYNRPKLPPVSLLSTQGSGNTWLRWLIERLTGICTTSIYGGERDLFKKGLKCEMGMPQNNRSIVQKCHYYQQCKTKKVLSVRFRYFERHWLLIRNPFDAMVADFHRMHTKANHTGVADPEVFSTEKWDYFVTKERGLEWFDQIQLVLSQAESVLVVFYENLKSNLRRELERVADFLDVYVSDDRLQCTLQYSSGKFKRNKTSNNAQFYTPAQVNVISSLMAAAVRTLRQYNVTNLPETYTEALYAPTVQ